MGYSLLLFGLFLWIVGISLGYLLLARLINAKGFILLSRVSIAPFAFLAALYLNQGLAGYRLLYFILFCSSYLAFFFYSGIASLYLPSVVRLSGVLRGSVVTLRPLRDYFLLVLLLQSPTWFR